MARLTDISASAPPDTAQRTAALRRAHAARGPKPWLAIAVLAIGLLLVAAGALQGDFLDTMRKAALVCYECIGIG